MPWFGYGPADRWGFKNVFPWSLTTKILLRKGQIWTGCFPSGVGYCVRNARPSPCALYFNKDVIWIVTDIRTMATNYQGRMEYHYVKLQKTGIKTSRLLTHLGRVRLGSIQIKNNWNNPSKRLFGSYSDSGKPGFPFRLFCSQEQNSQNIFRNIFLFRHIPNERALNGNRIFMYW